MPQPIRAVLTKLGLDSHEVGIKLVARYLRDAGFEVIYMGPYNSPETIVRTIVDENAAVLGFSVLTLGNHKSQILEILRLLEQEGAGDVVVVGGGIMPSDEVAVIRAAGVAAFYPPGTLLPESVQEIRDLVEQRFVSAQ